MQKQPARKNNQISICRHTKLIIIDIELNVAVSFTFYLINTSYRDFLEFQLLKSCQHPVWYIPDYMFSIYR